MALEFALFAAVIASLGAAAMIIAISNLAADAIGIRRPALSIDARKRWLIIASAAAGVIGMAFGLILLYMFLLEQQSVGRHLI